MSEKQLFMKGVVFRDGSNRTLAMIINENMGHKEFLDYLSKRTEISTEVLGRARIVWKAKSVDLSSRTEVEDFIKSFVKDETVTLIPARLSVTENPKYGVDSVIPQVFHELASQELSERDSRVVFSIGCCNMSDDMERAKLQQLPSSEQAALTPGAPGRRTVFLIDGAFMAAGGSQVFNLPEWEQDSVTRSQGDLGIKIFRHNKDHNLRIVVFPYPVPVDEHIGKVQTLMSKDFTTIECFVKERGSSFVVGNYYPCTGSGPAEIRFQTRPRDDGDPEPQAGGAAAAGPRR